MGQITRVDAQIKRLSLHGIAQIYDDKGQQLTIHPLLRPNALDFKPISNLNLGIALTIFGCLLS